jgi:hypothetical protein
MNAMKRNICFFIFAMAALPALAQIYKWKDANGVMQYSDTPPPANAVKSQVVDIRSMPVSAIGTGAAKASEASARAASKASAVVEQKVVYEKNEKMCAELRGRKIFLEKGTRTRVINEQGEAKRMDADMRKNEIADIEKQMAKVCP